MGADGQVKVRGEDGREENYEGADRNLLTVRDAAGWPALVTC